MPKSIEQRLFAILGDVLGLSEARVASLTRSTQLFGAMPELDSMAVAGLLTEIEDQFGIVVDDEDVSGDMLESIGTLADYISSKCSP